jgi:hypothetical protein
VKSFTGARYSASGIECSFSFRKTVVKAYGKRRSQSIFHTIFTGQFHLYGHLTNFIKMHHHRRGDVRLFPCLECLLVIRGQNKEVARAKKPCVLVDCLCAYDAAKKTPLEER